MKKAVLFSLILLFVGTASAAPLHIEIKKLLGSSTTTEPGEDRFNNLGVKEKGRLFSIQGSEGEVDGVEVVEPGGSLVYEASIYRSGDSDICRTTIWLENSDAGLDFRSTGKDVSQPCNTLQDVSISFNAPEQTGEYTIDFYYGWWNDWESSPEWKETKGFDTIRVAEDSDGDGILDPLDDCPDTSGQDQYNGCPPPDSDDDGIPDNEDEFPDDPRCSKDSDGDGVCDNKDAFPNDPNAQYDGDGDGVPDSEDECLDRKGSLENNGCPDSDGDGVPDPSDSCPNTGDQGFGLKPNGCPVGDDDGDGVGNDVDQCSDTPSGVNVDSNGCAVDSDNDGVPDYQDGCSSMEGPERFSGCPDSDGDGVPYNKDECRGQAGIGFGVKDNGCPVRDRDLDGIANSIDDCPQTYGSKQNGCPTVVDQIINFLGIRGWL